MLARTLAELGGVLAQLAAGHVVVTSSGLIVLATAALTCVVAGLLARRVSLARLVTSTRRHCLRASLTATATPGSRQLA